MTTTIIVVMLAGLLYADLRCIFHNGQKRLIWFYSICFVVSAVILILHSLNIPMSGPSQWIMELARSLSLL